LIVFTDILAQWLPAAIVGIGAIAIGLKRLHVRWASDETHVSAQKASKEIVDSLRAELVRLSEQNARLGASVNAMQLRIIELTAQVGKLTIENHALTQEVSGLRAELSQMNGHNTAHGNL
jgi:predicted nuclease with TOPRIM domain